MSQLQTRPTELDRAPPGGTHVFETKVRGFRPSPEMLPRPRLSQSLEKTRLALVLLAAPPGFGKTTLLGQWRELEERPLAWLAVDSLDNDPVVFWNGVVEAIRRVDPSFGGAADIALRASRVDVHDALVPLILHELGSSTREIVLVLDDYHMIKNRACHDSLAFFLEKKPSNVQLVLSTRSDPPIPIAKLRAAGELLELRAVDLCFTEGEEASFLNERLQLGLGAECLGVLHQRTEGWPAGVYLASLSLRNGHDRAAFVAHFGGSNRHVADYLTEVVLTRLDEKQREFLLETSILESICAPLCEAVTGRDGSAELLAELERANLFLAPLDDRREWYRYHPLFAGLLQGQLVQHGQDRLPDLHRRASAWFAEAGYTNEAVRHAMAAGETETASDLVVERWLSDPHVHLGGAQTMFRRLEGFPREAFEHDAPLALVKAWTMSMLNRHEDVVAALEVVETADNQRALPDGSSLDATVALVRGCFPWGDVGHALAAAGHARELQGELSPMWQPVSLLSLGWMHYLADHADKAKAPLERAALLADRLEQWLVASVARGILARIAVAAGDLGTAEVSAREAVDILEAHELSDQPGAGIAYVALGAVLARQGRVDEAGQLLDRGLARLRARGEQLDVADALLVSAPVRRALGTLAEGRALVAEARTLIEGCPDPGVLRERLEEVARTLTPAHRRIEGDSELTERELEVLRHLAEGLPKRDIGKVLFLSYNTIHSHTKSIYQKLRVSSRQAAIERARELGAL